MAGSWGHMTTEGGQLRNNRSFIGMIENLGDAYEAAEECYGMVWFLARQVAVSRGTPDRAAILAVIEEAEANYEAGLRAGGVQRD